MGKINLYVLPAEESGFNDQLFKPWEHEDRGGITNFQYWAWLKRACEKRSIIIHTTDFWSPEKSTPDDILLVQNHPGETLFWRAFYFLKHPRARGGFMLARRNFLYRNYKLFKRRVLWHAESPVSTPYVYQHMDRILRSGIYQKVILLGRGQSSNYAHLDYYALREHDLTSIYINEPKEKFLVMINSNTAPHSLKEFYGERLRAIRYFADKQVFDFYGHRWDKRPRHPFYFHYKKYVDKVWRGAVDDKLKTLSAYKFSLCFENCSYPGYVSEKIFDCLAVGCIPIYLGAPDIERIVPSTCFIDFKKFSTRGGSTFGGKNYNYDELYAHLSSLTETDLENYRSAILTFLRDKSSMKGMDLLVREILS